MRLYFAKFVAFIVMLQILNLSIYAQDFEQTEPQHTIGNLNEINSVVEYIAEIVLDNTNALPEVQKAGQKDLQFHKHLTMKLLAVNERHEQKVPQTPGDVFTCPLKDDYAFLFCKEINPPPPKA